VIKYKIFGLLLLAAALISCQDRERNNIFDPKTTVDSLNLYMRVSRSDTLIELDWSKPFGVEFSGFNLYGRKLPAEDFSLLASLPASQRGYRQRGISLDEQYEYYLTVLGTDGESVPTKVLKTVPGLETFWVLDQWDFTILRYSYDFRHLLSRRYAVWYPQSLALAPEYSTAVVTYPAYKYFEVFNMNTSEVIAGSEDMMRPYDCQYDSRSRGFWIADSSTGLFSYNIGENLLTLKSTSPQKPVQVIVEDSGIWLVDRSLKALLFYNRNGQLGRTVRTFGNYTLMDPYFLEIDDINNFYYVLDHAGENDKIYRFTSSLSNAELIYQGQNISKIRSDSFSNSIWVVENNDQDATVMQLSAYGSRLKELAGFNYITDIRIKQQNGNIIIADLGDRKITHLRPDGSIVGFTQNYVYPFKVYAQ